MSDETSILKKGSPVLLVLHSPREKCWGMLDEVTSAGVFLRGLDLKAFDDWLSAVVHQEPFIGLRLDVFPDCGELNESPGMKLPERSRRCVSKPSNGPGSVLTS